MPSDAARSDDDDLLSQIDELKARMDRLMQGGTSTSNSALLTDPPKATPPSVVESEPTPAPPPPRTRVRDLIGPKDEDEGGSFPPQREIVSFPDEVDSAVERRPADRPAEERPSSPPPPSKPKQAAVDGSLISVDGAREEARPKVESFDELGSAIEEELARDASVPPASSRKGPDLASRFGPVESEVEAELPEADDAEDTEDDDHVEHEEYDDHDEYEEFDEYDEYEDEPVYDERSKIGAVVAIWAFTAITSGAIATLHFTGVI
ncbi:MAG: hypothetical protein QNJ81_14300 [Acidimicrobiia bacterium]|nr:hypothetical protein [Acidimicrobiia bacterium]